METGYIILVSLIAGIAVGAVLGWLICSRTGRARETEFKAAIKELGDARIEVATLKANSDNFDKQIALLQQARDDLLAQFKAAGGEVLSKAQEEFLKTAAERFGNSEKSNKEAVAALLEPVSQRLKRYEDHVEALEAKRQDAFGQLTGLLESMRVGQEQVKAEAVRLGNTLRNAPKSRGQWGEKQLRNVLEQCGLAEHTDFVTEHSVESSEGRLRPDALVFLPGNKLLVIDAKASMKHYQDACEATDDKEREACLDLHVASIRTHIQALAAKGYQSQFPNAPDYVIMFVPGENHLAAALEHAERKTIMDLEGGRHTEDLWTYAFKQRVLLASPANLVAIARTVEQVWKQDKLAKEAIEIGKAATELYDRLAISAEHLKRVGGGIQTAVANYNKFVGSFERNVLSAGRRFRDQGVNIGKRQIEEVSLVELTPTYTALGHAELPDAALVEPETEEEGNG